jgi:hypothetical protein
MGRLHEKVKKLQMEAEKLSTTSPLDGDALRKQFRLLRMHATVATKHIERRRKLDSSTYDQYPLLAPSGHRLLHRACPLSGVKADIALCDAYVCFCYSTVHKKRGRPLDTRRGLKQTDAHRVTWSRRTHNRERKTKFVSLLTPLLLPGIAARIRYPIPSALMEWYSVAV